MIQSQARSDPKFMAKQELEEEGDKKKKNNNGAKEGPNPKKKEVIITVYVESSSDSQSQQQSDQLKKIKPNRNTKKPHQIAKKGSYDRRAQLLAYSQELRTAGDSQQVQWPKNGSKPKWRVGGNKRFKTPVRLRTTKSSQRYQRLVPQVDIPCNPKSIIGKKKKASASEKKSNFLMKLRDIVRGLSWDCNKGSKVAEKNQAV